MAKTPAELAEKLPRLLGVRHITSAKQWTPFATNLYMLSLYMSLFAKHYPDEQLTLKPELVETVGKMVSVGTTVTRRSLQAASAFSHMRAEFEDKLSKGDSFSDADHYYFENILTNKYAQE